MWKHDRKIAQLIHSAIDSYPAGLSFSTLSGLPILVNEKMNRLVWSLTGHTLLEAEATWQELKDGEIRETCARCDPQWLELQESPHRENLVFSLPDGRIWHFEKQLLTDRQPHTVQITASDVTELYEAGRKLYENNQRLLSLHRRQKQLLQNIVKVNQEKELLSAKVRIHDEFGRCLLMTRMALDSPPEDYGEIRDSWRRSIRALQSIPGANPPQTSEPERELVNISEMIGCRLQFLGPRPAGRTQTLLFYAAVREALTNAVRHGHAQILTVETRERDRDYRVEIRDDGLGSAPGAAEGGGLTALRRRLEQEGATLEVRWQPGVTLILSIPKEGREFL